MAAGNTELGSAFVTIYPQVDKNFRTTVGREFSRGIDANEFGAAGGATGKKFGASFKAAAAAALETLGDILQDFVHWAMNILGDLTREAISNEDALIKFSKSMSFAGFDESQIADLQQQMMEYADATIFELSDIVGLTGQLGAMGVDNFEQLAEAAGNLTAVAGFGATEFSYFAKALSQLNTAGVLKTQDWYQVQNALGAGAVAIQNELIAMGAFEGGIEDWSEALSNGEISAEEFNQAVMNLGMDEAAIDAATSTDTFEGAMAQLRASCVGAIMDIIEAIGMENITAFIGRLAEIIPPLIQKFAPMIEDLAAKLYDFVMSIDVDKVGGSIEGFFRFFGENKDTLQKCFAPMMQIVPGLVEAFQTIAQNAKALWDEVLQPMGQGIANFFGSVWSAIGDSINAFIGNVQALWEVITGFWDTLTGVFSGIQGFFASFSMEDFKAKITEALTYIRDYFSTKFDEVKTKVTTVFANIKQVISEKLEAAKTAVRNAIEKIKSYFNFDWHLPHLKLPHITITGDWGFNPPRVPSFGIEWYAQGGVFETPSIIGIGERGPEAVVPLAGSAMQPFAAEVAANMRMGGVIDELEALREDVRNVRLYLDGTVLVGGIASRMDTALGGRQFAAERGF